METDLRQINREIESLTAQVQAGSSLGEDAGVTIVLHSCLKVGSLFVPNEMGISRFGTTTPIVSSRDPVFRRMAAVEKAGKDDKYLIR